MVTANVLEAKNGLSGLLRLLESGQEDCVVIARHNKPVAKLVPIDAPETSQRIGVAKGKRLFAEGWDDSETNAEIARMFGVEQ